MLNIDNDWQFGAMLCESILGCHEKANAIKSGTERTETLHGIYMVLSNLISIKKSIETGNLPSVVCQKFR